MHTKNRLNKAGFILLMRQSKKELVFLASTNHLDCWGSKASIARRVHYYQQEKANRYWLKILEKKQCRLT